MGMADRDERKATDVIYLTCEVSPPTELYYATIFMCVYLMSIQDN